MQTQGKPGRAVRLLIGASALYVVGVIGGVLAWLNVSRLARIHIDGGVPLTRWAILQIQVGHVFVKHGVILFQIATLALGGLWLGFAVCAKTSSRVRPKASP
jgi:hypothetical protein